ncbi:MAG: hypothetical protein AB1896_22495 [Thermodesulfobacteriota bacterium]
MNDRFASLRTLFSGTTAPASPVQYQVWLDTSGTTPRLKVWDGSAWQDITAYLYVFMALKAELETARGSASTLDARLDVAINEDGTLKAGAPAGGWWATEADTVAYASASSFTVSGDKTAIYVARRAVYLDQTSPAYGHVVSSSYSAPDTTVVVDCTVDTGLTAVEYGQPVNNDAIHNQATTSAQGIAELATDAEVQAGTDAERIVTPAGLAACTATETRKGVAELATDAEVQAGTDAERIVTPAGLAACTATDTRAGVIEVAVQSEMEAGTDTGRAVTPGRQKYHPSAAKAWVNFSMSTATIFGSYNVTSITDNGVGDFTVTWDVDFSSTSYAVTWSAGYYNASANNLLGGPYSVAVGSMSLQVRNYQNTLIDPNHVSLAAFGDQ